MVLQCIAPVPQSTSTIVTSLTLIYIKGNQSRTEIFYQASWEHVLYDILGSPQSRDLGHDNLEFQVVVRNLEIDMRLVSPPDGHSENTGARSQLSCHDSSLPSKRIWWHIMTQWYLQMYKMMWNCVIGNFIVGKKLQLCLFDQSAAAPGAAHLRWNAGGYVMNCCLKLIV